MSSAHAAVVQGGGGQVDRVPLMARRATAADAERVTDIITLAFQRDPLWGHAMARQDGSTAHHAAFWRLFVEGALRYPWTWLTDGAEATSVWIPPGGTDMTDEQAARLIGLATRELGPRAPDYAELLARFEADHPRDEPHFYLTLLATHPDHRGRGIGMRLLAHDLELIDQERAPAYLESSNSANDARYGRLGFEPIGRLSYPGDGPAVTTMWRPAR